MKTAKSILTEARTLLADPAHWTQGAYARTAEGVSIPPTSPNAACFCALGAVGRAWGVDPTQVTSGSSRSIAGWRELWAVDEVIYVNDHMGHAGVLAMFDKAIAIAPDVPETPPVPDRK